MDKLIKAIEHIRTGLEKWRQHALKETPTRTIVIDPLLEALGWDVRAPDEVQLEYHTVDGKSVDYALKINGNPVLLVEAKALDDPLEDVKAITQVVGYAANAGIAWCVLTNGVRWKVFRSMEKCAAPDKLMFEVDLDPHVTAADSVTDVAAQMWRLSREEMAKGTLDALGEKVFTDGKVRKALDAILLDPPRKFLSLLREQIGDEELNSQRIRESLARIRSRIGTIALDLGPTRASAQGAQDSADSWRTAAPRRAWARRKVRASQASYDESLHIGGKPQDVVALYRAIDRFCLSLNPERISKRYLAKYISYDFGERSFCSVHVQQGGLHVWLPLSYDRLENPPPFARDVSHVGHWGIGDLALRLRSLEDVEAAKPLIRQSFEASG